jgi:proteasome accessory factor B
MRMVMVLHNSRRGLTEKNLELELGSSRSTVYRDLKSLHKLDVGLQCDTVNGEVRYHLRRMPVAAVAATPLELAALCLARDALDSFAGTAAVEQIDQLLKRWGHVPKAQLSLTFHRRGTTRASLVGTLDGAIIRKQRVELEYQGERDPKPKQRKIEPLALRAAGEQLYLFAYDVDRADYRVFKTARVQKAWILGEPSNDHSRVDLEARFKNAVKTWTADEPTHVVVRISAEKSRFLNEYPLMPTQRLTALPDGRVEITADVNGTTEAVAWILGWGAHAEAISPEELREKVAEQVRGAAAKYGASDAVQETKTKAERQSARTKQAVSREVRRRESRVGT